MTMGRFAFAAISTAYLVIAVPFGAIAAARFGPPYDAYRRRSLAHRPRTVY
jgi:hypothetical protein